MWPQVSVRAGIWFSHASNLRLSAGNLNTRALNYICVSVCACVHACACIMCDCRAAYKQSLHTLPIEVNTELECKRGESWLLSAADCNSFTASRSDAWRPKGTGSVNLQLNTSSADFSGSTPQSELNSPTIIAMETNETEGVSAGAAAAAAAPSPAIDDGCLALRAH